MRTKRIVEIHSVRLFTVPWNLLFGSRIPFAQIKQKYVNFFFSIISLYSSPFDFYTLIFDPFVPNFSSLLLIFGCTKNWLHDDTYLIMLILDAFYFFISFHLHRIVFNYSLQINVFFRVLFCHRIQPKVLLNALRPSQNELNPKN